MRITPMVMAGIALVAMLPCAALDAAEKHRNDVVDAVAAYQRVSREHVADDPASFWVAWPGKGYRLEPVTIGPLAMVAIRGNVPGTKSYAIALDTPTVACGSSAAGAPQVFSLDATRLSFHGACVGDVMVYRPLHAADVTRLNRRMEKGGRLVVRGANATATFDLSGIPVLKAMFTAEAAAASSRSSKEANPD